MNDLIEAPAGALAMSEEELISVLGNSIYPGAKLESIKMVVAYCKAARLDPLQKPVHIVPMSVKKPGSRDEYEYRDVVMPGIGLYRTQAARTGQLAGIDEPEFGPTVELKLGNTTISVPEWCRVTVYRLVAGEPRPFTAREFWVENYATAGRNTEAPNSMWKRRKFGQLAKCAEAQALRKAFPEIGSQPTAEEMEGRDVLLDEIDGLTGEHATAKQGPKVARKTKPKADDKPQGDVIEGELVAKDEKPEPKTPASNINGGDDLIGIGERKYLENKARSLDVDLGELLKEMGGLDLERLSKTDFHTVKSELLRRG